MNLIGLGDTAIKKAKRILSSESNVSKNIIAREFHSNKVASRIQDRMFQRTLQEEKISADAFKELSADDLATLNKKAEVKTQSYLASDTGQKVLNRLTDSSLNNSNLTQAWLKTSRAQDGMIYKDILGSALTGAAIGGVGSFATGADTSDAMFTGALMGAVGGGFSARARALRSNTIEEKLGKIGALKKVREQELSSLKKKSPNAKMTKTKNKILKKTVNAEKKYKQELEANSGLRFAGIGMLAGAGSLAYATLDSNRV